ncbi:hypothetical protein HHK36_022615 [Tetracentron sinense]|uniref:Uncharacterized protein n=1 Tax=Tetracentron sinense TaxID=13715 RepID=A0A834YTB1_TETSI|nr:hypothetical protein HHK36_022615 [Tetracentron sinense]
MAVETLRLRKESFSCSGKEPVTVVEPTNFGDGGIARSPAVPSAAIKQWQTVYVAADARNMLSLAGSPVDFPVGSDFSGYKFEAIRKEAKKPLSFDLNLPPPLF